MNFLSNLASSIGSGISSAAGAVKSFFTSPVPSVFGPGPASTPAQNLLASPLAALKNLFFPSAQAPSYDPNKPVSTDIGGKPYNPTPEQAALDKTLQGLKGTTVRPSSASVNTTTGAVTPTPTQPQQPQQPQQPSPTYAPFAGPLTHVPTQGKPGVAGVSASPGGVGGASAVSGAQGAPGEQTGRSSFTGLLGGAGGLGTPGLVTDEQAEEKKKIFKTGTFQEPFRTKTPSGALDLGSITAGVTEISKMLSSGNPLSTTDKAGFMNYLNEATNALVETQNNMNPLPDAPVVDTQGQSDFLNNLPEGEKSGLKVQMDTFREQIGLPGLEKARVDVMSKLNATLNIYQKIVDDISNNPDLPKGLAARRIREFNKEYSTTIQNLQGQLAITNQQITDGNDRVNMEFKISESEESRRQNAIDNSRAILQQYISTGALSVFDDTQLKQIADAGIGYNYSALISMRKALQDSQDKYSNFSVQTDEQGNATVIGITKDGKVSVLSKIAGVAKPKSESEVETKLIGIENILSRSKGTDGFVDPDIYLTQRQRANIGADEFDRKFGHLLSEGEKGRLKIGKQGLDFGDL